MTCTALPLTCWRCGGAWSRRVNRVAHGPRCDDRAQRRPKVQSPAWPLIVELVARHDVLIESAGGRQ